MYRVKLRFCIDGDDEEDNGKLIEGMRDMLTANNDENHRFFISRDDHEILSRLVKGITHTEFIEVNGDAFRDKLRGNIMGCDQLTEAEKERFLEVVDLMERIGQRQVVVNPKIPPLFKTAKLS